MAVPIQRKVCRVVVGIVGIVGIAGCQTGGPTPVVAPVVSTSIVVAPVVVSPVVSAVVSAASVSSVVGTLASSVVRRTAVDIVATFPHQTDAFTEGLVWADGVLYESVGLTGKSELRRVTLDTGVTEVSTDLADDEFGEGLALVGDRLVQLTWTSGVGHVYDRATFARLGSFAYPGEGWGLVYDGQRLIMSDGTAELRFLDPATYVETGRLTVTEDGTPVERLNELEFVDGYVYANVWLTPDVVIIDPSTGRVAMRLDTSALRPPSTLSDNDAVANGIAYDPVGDRLFITGKRWPTMYEIRRPEV